MAEDVEVAPDQHVGGQERVDAIVALWTDGDYGTVGELFDPVSERLVSSLDLDGQRVLDAATGTGNTAIHAARAGANVEAFDLTPTLLDQARQRAAAAGVDVRFVVGDLLDVPYADATFDVVVSTFGAFVVDDQRRCALELGRVCRSGGQVVTTAWTDTGIFGSMLEVLRTHHPAAFEHAPDQRAWADAGKLSGLFDGAAADISVAHERIWFDLPSVPGAFELFQEVSGPVRRLRASIEAADGDWQAVRADLEERWAELAEPAPGDRIALPADYAVATITVS